MPIYDYQCTNDECKDTHTKLVSFSEREAYEKDTKCTKCGSSIRQVIGAPSIVSDVATKQRGSSEFRNYLEKMKKNHPGSNMTV